MVLHIHHHLVCTTGIKVDKAPSSWCPVFRALKTPMSGESEETELSELRLIGAQGKSPGSTYRYFSFKILQY